VQTKRKKKQERGRKKYFWAHVVKVRQSCKNLLLNLATTFRILIGFEPIGMPTNVFCLYIILTNGGAWKIVA
jgi:hypothetical protein